MIEIRKIIVPVDFSGASRKALAHAITLATTFAADLVVAHIVEDPLFLNYYSSGAVRPRKASLGEIGAELADLVPDKVRESNKFSFIVRAGLAEDELLGAIKEERADLVVMGTHGRRAFRRWFIGSVTEHMLRHLPVQVLTVSHPEENAAEWALSGGRILYATDFSSGSERGLGMAHDLAQRFEAELTILHAMLPLHLEYGIQYIPTDIVADHHRIREDLMDRLKQSIPVTMQSDPTVHLTVEEGVPYEVIPDTADRLDADLIIINLHGKHRTARPVLGATAERVVRTSHRPVLSIPMDDF